MDNSKPIDPGAEPSKPHSLEWVIALVGRGPDRTLERGEAGLLVAEIERLRGEVSRLENMYLTSIPR